MLNGVLFLGDQNLLILVNLRVITDLVFLHSRPEDLRMVGPQAPNHFFAVCLCPRCQQKKKRVVFRFIINSTLSSKFFLSPKNKPKTALPASSTTGIFNTAAKKKKTKLIYILSNEIVS